MLVREASGDEFLAMRLAHDKILGVNDCYINARLTELRGEPFTILSSETYQTATDGGGSNPITSSKYFVSYQRKTSTDNFVHLNNGFA